MDGFFQVRSRRLERRRSPPRVSRPVPPELVGLCFNCLASSHIKAVCRYPPQCYNCWGEGHHASSCLLPARQGLAAALGTKRTRSLPSRERRRVSRRRGTPPRHSRGSADTVSAGSASTGWSTSVPRCCRPPTTPLPPPPPLPLPPPAAADAVTPVMEVPNATAAAAGDMMVGDWPDRSHLSPIIVVPRTADIHDVEDALGRSLVVMIGGTRPAVSMAMVSSYLFEHFGITRLDADVRRHDPEDFIVHFRHLADRDRVLGTRPTGAPLPLVWHPWRRTSTTSAGSFCYKVLVGMKCVPAHARSAMTAQTILGPSCGNIEVVWPRDVEDNDDREFFVTAWCWHPRSIQHEQIIFIPEPSFQGACEVARSELPGLRYLVRIRLIAYQDWATPPPSPPGDAGDDGDNGPRGDDGTGEPSVEPCTPADETSAGRDSEVDDNDDSNNNNRHHLGFSQRWHAILPTGVPVSGESVQVGLVRCPLGRQAATGGAGGSVILDVLSRAACLFCGQEPGRGPCQWRGRPDSRGLVACLASFYGSTRAHDLCGPGG